MAVIEFHRAFDLELQTSKSFELLKVSIAIEGPVDSMSGMVLNLSVVDRWIENFKRQNALRRNEKSINWKSRSDCFQSLHHYFFECCKNEEVSLKSFSLQAQDRSVLWSSELDWPHCFFYFQQKWITPKFDSAKVMKTVQVEIGLRGQLHERFRLPPRTDLKKIYQDALHGELSRLSQKPAVNNQIVSLRFFDQELGVPIVIKLN